MPRPGLIVGLGGTGQWVLTWLKRDLQLAFGGQLPENIRLLEIDTASQLEASATQVTARDQQEERAEVGGVTLEREEFIYLGGDSRPIAEEVSEGALPQIGQWYQASRWLQSQTPAAFILDDGAGRLRQFGRMSVFMDILGKSVSSKIWQAMYSAISAVKEQTSDKNRLEIVVVGSFAGGTGSGMFIDVALLLRMIAQQLGVHHVLRGYFALPNVFNSNPNEEMRARTFAAWRELNRFMVVDPDYSMPLIEYVEKDTQFRIRPSLRLFDACYLVDGRRGGQPIPQEAKYGVFPMMAEVISAILDEKAGMLYSQWVTTNLATVYASQPFQPMYSAVGAYTIQIPAYFKEEISSNQFARNLVLQMLSPRAKPDDRGRLPSAGAERHLALAAPDQNQEDPGFAGSKRSQQVLTTSIERGGRITKPTRFHGRIWTVVDESLNQNKQAAVVRQLAMAAAVDTKNAKAIGGGMGWAAFFPNLGGDPHFEQLQQRLDTLIGFHIPSQYGRKDDDNEEAARSRLHKISDDVRKRFGGMTTNGEEAEEVFGEVGDVLKECQAAQLSIFRQVLRAHMDNLLMGRNPDALIARSGKLGYTWSYFDGLVSILNQFLTIMDEVKRTRDDLKPEVKMQGMEAAAKKFLLSTQGKKIFWLWEHPNVKGSETAYLQAQQRLLDLRKDEILHVFVVETVQKMIKYAEDAREALQRWIWHLSTGDDSSQLPGIYDGCLLEMDGITKAKEFDTKAPQVQRVVADEVVEANTGDLRAALERWEWVVTHDEEGNIHLTAQILPAVNNGAVAVLEDPYWQSSTLLKRKMSSSNQQNLIGLARRRFAGMAARTTVAEVLKTEFTAKDLAEKIANLNAEPLFTSGPIISPPRRKSNLIRVMASETDDYFVGPDGLQAHLRKKNNLSPNKVDDNHSIQVVGSENPYKITFVRTDDLYDFEAFGAWRDCQKAYAGHLDDADLLDPVLMQNFAAEQHAVEYERKLARGADYQPLHPRVVMLLESPIRFRQIVYLMMLGKVRDTPKDLKNYHWEVMWEKSSGAQPYWLTKSWDKDRDSGKRAQPGAFQVMHGYIIIRINQAPGRRDLLDTDIAEAMIEKALKSYGEGDAIAGEIQLLEKHLGDEGLIAGLREQAMDPDKPESVIRQDFDDLASVIEADLKERLEELRAIQGTGQSTEEEDPNYNPFAPKRR